MSSIAYRLDRALDALKTRGLAPVTIILRDADYEALCLMEDWPMTRSIRGEMRFRSTAVFQARGGEGGSIVGRGMDGGTRRIAFDEDDRSPATAVETTPPQPK